MKALAPGEEKRLYHEVLEETKAYMTSALVEYPEWLLAYPQA